MHRTFCAFTVALSLLAVPRPALAGWDLLIFLGRAFPRSDDRLTFPLPAPSVPGVDVTVTGTPRIETDGGPTFGGALAAEAGVIGIEGRLDSVRIGFDLTGARYDLLGVAPPLTGLTATVVLPNGRFDIDRLNLWSFNLRLRTPGPVGLVASGGVTHLPDFEISGSVPITVQDGPVQGAGTRLRLGIAPGESRNRTGVNAGAGLRAGGDRVALVAEGRVFYFREYELQILADGDLPVFGGASTAFAPVRFRPVIVTAQAGLLFRF